MNVAIVGNSNCVFRNGFSHGVNKAVSRFGGVVNNYSLGGSCCALHIYTLHDKYADLRSADVVFLDSLVIDSFHWKRGIIRYDELLSLIDDMYALYSQLSAKVVAILFPVEKYINNHKSHKIYQAHCNSARKYGVDVVDLYNLFPKGLSDYSKYFMQPGHINVEIASDVGERITSSCLGMGANPGEVDEFSSLYEVVSDVLLSGLEKVHVESSYYTAECYKLDRNISLSPKIDKSLIGVFHWNKTEQSKFVLSSCGDDDVVQFRSRYAFFEVLNARRKIQKDTEVRPGWRGESVTQKPAGKFREAGYGFPQLMGLLLRRDGEMSVKYIGQNSDLSPLVGNVFG